MESNLFMICYDLNSPGQDYTELITQIKSYGTWWHHLDSTWIIKSKKTAVEIRDHLGKYIDTNDELLVVKFGDAWAGKGFEEKAYNWLRNNAYK